MLRARFMDPVELAAALLGLVSVVLTVREHVWTWPIGAVMYVLYFFTFVGARLYADAGLQVIGFVLQFYGWHQWLRGGAGGRSLTIGRLDAQRFAVLMVAGALGTIALGAALTRWTDQALAYWDSGIAVYSLIAQYLLARKRLETWWIWIAIDVVAVGVFWSRGLLATAVLYGLFFFLASAGLRAWYLTWRAQTGAAAPMDEVSVAIP
jgi:nicotinamide mononucleotide transporter